MEAKLYPSYQDISWKADAIYHRLRARDQEEQTVEDCRRIVRLDRAKAKMGRDIRGVLYTALALSLLAGITYYTGKVAPTAPAVTGVHGGVQP